MSWELAGRILVSVAVVYLTIKALAAADRKEIGLAFFYLTFAVAIGIGGDAL